MKCGNYYLRLKGQLVLLESEKLVMAYSERTSCLPLGKTCLRINTLCLVL